MSDQEVSLSSLGKLLNLIQVSISSVIKIGKWKIKSPPFFPHLPKSLSAERWITSDCLYPTDSATYA